ncbi:hypothetical protein CORC01_03074 [Colletotrichum orchidophilum]|uniref:Uncharacterized protein n=1 Tax=Colletotrichum orchidophilum TaxID=1209926 RepID=A0A1G4BJI7_9PEZI|nr:uncharacterized protein CORC01_03074 [Colletotrichum orchidophilum]OHF01584.1 hypothetical protein CORC01_03074 [Colletotrichum orchidophilum]
MYVSTRWRSPSTSAASSPLHAQIRCSLYSPKWMQTETDGGLVVASAIRSVWDKCNCRPGSWNFFPPMLIEGTLEKAFPSAFP